ncbi:GlcG/HbpS family heme-binding protein [Frateuria aurantia]
MNKLSLTLAAAFGLGSAVAAHAADPAQISLSQARQMAAAAEAQAGTDHADDVVTVMDAGGNIILVERMANAQLASIELSIKKAHSAVFYKRPTRSLEQDVAHGLNNVLGLPGALPAGGGVPLMEGNTVIGAIGVSGGNNIQDNHAAEVGAAVYFKQAR